MKRALTLVVGLLWTFPALGGAPSDPVVVGPDGDVYALDYIDGRVVRVSADGALDEVYSGSHARLSRSMGAEHARKVAFVEGRLILDTRAHEERTAPGLVPPLTALVGGKPESVEISGVHKHLFEYSGAAAMGADGTVYRVNLGIDLHRVDPDGTTHPIPYDDPCAERSGRSIPAFVSGLAVGPEGALYLTDINRRCLLRLTASGVDKGADGRFVGVETDAKGTIYTMSYDPEGLVLWRALPGDALSQWVVL